MKNNKEFIFEDGEAEAEAEDDVSLPSDSGESGLEPEQEELVLNSAIQGTQDTLPEKEPCPVEGFDIETIAERIADAVEFRRFIRHKGR